MHGGTIGDTYRVNYFGLKWDPSVEGTVSTLDWGAASPQLILYYRQARYVCFYADDVLVHVEKVFTEDLETSISSEEMPAVPQKNGFTASWDRQSLSNEDFTADGSVRVNAVYTPVADEWHGISVTGGVIVSIGGKEQEENTTAAEAVAGTEISVKPVVPAGKVFEDWSVTGGVQLREENGLYIFTLGESDVTLIAQFSDIPSYAVNVEGGTIVQIGNSPAEETACTVPSGTVIAVQPDAAEEGVRFAGWEGGDLAEGQNGTWTIIVTAPLDLSAAWEISVTFTADGETVETIWVDEGGTLAAADFPAVPQKAGHTGAWNVSADIEDISAPVDVSAEYTANVHTVSVPDGFTGGGDYAYGATVTLRAPEGSAIKEWKGISGTVGDDGSFSFTMPDGDVEITVEYKEETGGGCGASFGGTGLLLAATVLACGAVAVRSRRNKA